ncbi:MAG: methyltransferase [Bacteroidaceae bacterium]|nr:methyltransferase [Bacteroidaceae bacterium]
MSAPYFRFQQFIVRHDRSSMRVGTDGVLLGAWAKLDGALRILDIGTGCGLIALMAAQRATEAQITAVEIDHESAMQASENVADSPFADRISIVEQDIRLLPGNAVFDHVLCNPPYHLETTLPPSVTRMRARHTEALSFESLIGCAKRLLVPGGLFSVVLPASATDGFVGLSLVSGLRLQRRCDVLTVPHRPPKRILLTLQHPRAEGNEASDNSLLHETLILQDAQGGRSEEYQRLTRDFYL